MSRALVTGGAGFIGSHLVRRLLSRGREVVVLDNLYTGSRENIKELDGASGLTFVEQDICEANANAFFKVYGPFDEIYNLACPASPVHYQAQPLGTALTSIKGVLFSLELARLSGAKLLHASTSEIYGDPLTHPQKETDWGNVNTVGVRSCYDEGKRVAETLVADYVRAHGVDARMVRIFNTYGPRMDACDGRVVSNFIVQALQGKPITVYGDGSQTRSFQYVDDLVDAFELYMAKDAATLDEFFARHNLETRVLNIGNQGEFTIGELAQMVIAKIPEANKDIVFKPLPGNDPRRRRPDTTLAKELLGWQAKIPLATGLDRTIEYFKLQIRNTSDDIRRSSESAEEVRTGTRPRLLGQAQSKGTRSASRANRDD